jgi:hypothetical protein
LSPSLRRQGALRERGVEERKADRIEEAAELKAKAAQWRREDAAYAEQKAAEGAISETVRATVEAARRRRREAQRIAQMGPDEYRKYLDEKRERKEQLKLTAERLRAGVAP